MTSTERVSALNASVEEWDTKQNGETIKIAFEESRSLEATQAGLFESVDTKLVAVFTVASAIVTFAPGIKWGATLSGPSQTLWLIAVAAWLTAALLCSAGYGPKDFKVGPNPKALIEGNWTQLTPDQYRFYRLRDMGEAQEGNGLQVKKKAAILRYAVVATALEIVALLLALLSS